MIFKMLKPECERHEIDISLRIVCRSHNEKAAESLELMYISCILSRSRSKVFVGGISSINSYSLEVECLTNAFHTVIGLKLIAHCHLELPDAMPLPS